MLHAKTEGSQRYSSFRDEVNNVSVIIDTAMLESPVSGEPTVADHQAPPGPVGVSASGLTRTSYAMGGEGGCVLVGVCMCTSAGAGPVSLGLVTVLALLFTCGRGVGEGWQCTGNMTQQRIQTHHSYTHTHTHTHTHIHPHTHTFTHTNTQTTPGVPHRTLQLLMSCSPCADGATALSGGRSLVSIRSTSNPSHLTTRKNTFSHDSHPQLGTDRDAFYIASLSTPKSRSVFSTKAH